MAICGAKTKGEKKCQRSVSKGSKHCHLHSDSALWSKILGACDAIVKITAAAQGVAWTYHTAWPYIEPIFKHGSYCPESFWWDGLASPVRQGKSPADVHSRLKKALAQMRTDQKRTEQRLGSLSNRDRERLLSAYTGVLAEIRKSYPDRSTRS